MVQLRRTPLVLPPDVELGGLTVRNHTNMVPGLHTKILRVVGRSESIRRLVELGLKAKGK